MDEWVTYNRDRRVTGKTIFTRQVCCLSSKKHFLRTHVVKLRPPLDLRYHYSPAHFMAFWKFPLGNILTPAPPIAGNLIVTLPSKCIFVYVFGRNRDVRACVCKYLCVTFYEAEAAAAHNGLKAEDSKWNNLLASCRLEANGQNKC